MLPCFFLTTTSALPRFSLKLKAVAISGREGALFTAKMTPYDLPHPVPTLTVQQTLPSQHESSPTREESEDWVK